MITINGLDGDMRQSICGVHHFSQIQFNLIRKKKFIKIIIPNNQMTLHC